MLFVERNCFRLFSLTYGHKASLSNTDELSHVHLFSCCRRWSGGAMVLGKLPVPGLPTTSVDSRARAYCACSGCGWGLFGHFSLDCLFSLLSPAL